MVRNPRLVVAIVATLFFAGSAVHADRQYVGRHRIYVRNLSDRPVTILFKRGTTGFRVRRVGESRAALIENVPQGTWSFLVDELLNDNNVGAGTFEFKAGSKNVELRITGNWVPNGVAAFDAMVFQD